MRIRRAIPAMDQMVVPVPHGRDRISVLARELREQGQPFDQWRVVGASLADFWPGGICMHAPEALALEYDLVISKLLN